MCSEPIPKEFKKSSEVLPQYNCGISTYSEFKNVEDDAQHQEFLKRVGLTNEEMKMYRDNEAGLLKNQSKMESNILDDKLEYIYNKINTYNSQNKTEQSILHGNEQPSTSACHNMFEKLHKKPISFFPEGHPMNDIKEIEESLFRHLKNDKIIPITKRRKILRRLERKKQRVLSQEHQLIKPSLNPERVNRPGSLWDMQELPVKVQKKNTEHSKDRFIGPRNQTMYTVQENRIVRLEPVRQDNEAESAQNERVQERPEENEDVDVETAEEELLEGTKMCVDDIKKIDRFKDYEPGIPSKILYLKNIAPAVTHEQLSLLFNQFVLDNGGPIFVRLLTGRMRGQAFVSFQNEDLAIRALEEINGTILSGRPVIAEFGRNSNRVQVD